jgi:hypothetical protein
MPGMLTSKTIRPATPKLRIPRKGRNCLRVNPQAKPAQGSCFHSPDRRETTEIRYSLPRCSIRILMLMRIS